MRYHKCQHTLGRQIGRLASHVARDSYQPLYDARQNLIATLDPAEQLELPGVDTGAPFFVIRALVRPGVKHNEAVDEFEPYDRTQIELPGMRKGIEETARRAIASNRRLYAYINNRTEGNAPNTIASVLELLFSE